MTNKDIYGNLATQLSLEDARSDSGPFEEEQVLAMVGASHVLNFVRYLAEGRFEEAIEYANHIPARHRLPEEFSDYARKKTTGPSSSVLPTSKDRVFAERTVIEISEGEFRGSLDEMLDHAEDVLGKDTIQHLGLYWSFRHVALKKTDSKGKSYASSVATDAGFPEAFTRYAEKEIFLPEYRQSR